MRYTFYDDNTIATEKEVDGETINQPSEIYLPGIFIQDEWQLTAQQTLLVGMRYDYNSLHGSIFTPRLNYKWTSRSKLNTLRLSAGSGYRVANVFTEDHAALTGAKEVVFLEELNPETSWNGNLYGPMVLPLLGELDPRMPESLPFSIQNIQITKVFKNGLEVFAGVKNLLNWTPNKGNPFIIARTNDPFDNDVQYGTNGNILATPENPYALKFDPDYTYGPNQGIRGFAGLRYTIK